MNPNAATPPHLRALDLTLAYGEQVVLRGVGFDVQRGDIFVIMGGSGCGKSTLMRHLVGLQPPAAGRVVFDGRDLWSLSAADRQACQRRMGILYQNGALWSSMTVGENVALPLRLHTPLEPGAVRDLVEVKLALVGLEGAAHRFPVELSGGMRKRAALARAIALDPEILFLDEPSAGLDPVGARRLDELVLELCASLKATVVVVSHELTSIFSIGTDSIFLDADAGTAIGGGAPLSLLQASTDDRIRDFLTRGGTLNGAVCEPVLRATAREPGAGEGT